LIIFIYECYLILYILNLTDFCIYFFKY
jgi:hypothetical protein